MNRFFFFILIFAVCFTGCATTQKVSKSPDSGQIVPAEAKRFYDEGESLWKGNGNYLNSWEAIESYKKAIEIYPRYADAYFGMAGAYEKLGAYSLAISPTKKVLILYRKHGNVKMVNSCELQLAREYDIAGSGGSNATSSQDAITQSRNAESQYRLIQFNQQMDRSIQNTINSVK